MKKYFFPETQRTIYTEGVNTWRIPIGCLRWRGRREPVRDWYQILVTYSTAQVKEQIFFFISRTNFTIRDFPPSGLE